MIRSEEHLRRLAERFTSAGLGGSWDDALAGLAEATGAPRAQLIGVGSEAAIPFNWITDLDPEALLEWLDIDGPDPRANARVRAGLTLAEMAIATDPEFTTEADLRSAVYKLYRKYDINHGCQTTLLRQPGCVVGMAILQGDREGPVQGQARRAFAALAGHARSAISLQIAMEEQAPDLIAGGFESINAAAFICDRNGFVRALTPAAEALVAEQRFLALSNRRLKAATPQDDVRLARALAVAGAPWPAVPESRELLIRAPDAAAPLQVQVAPLPRRDYAFRFHAAALVVARAPIPAENRGALLQSQYGLTPAETAIALALAGGQTLAAIAATRRVSVGTLRSQLKSIFGKLGVSRQAELAARLNEL